VNDFLCRLGLSLHKDHILSLFKFSVVYYSKNLCVCEEVTLNRSLNYYGVMVMEIDRSCVVNEFYNDRGCNVEAASAKLSLGLWNQYVVTFSQAEICPTRDFNVSVDVDLYSAIIAKLLVHASKMRNRKVLRSSKSSPESTPGLVDWQRVPGYQTGNKERRRPNIKRRRRCQ